MSDGLATVLPIVGYSLGGLLVGFLLGRFGCDVHRIATALRLRRDTDREDTPMRPSGPPPPWWRRLSGQRLIGAVVVLLAVFTAVQGNLNSRENNRIQQCLRAYSDGFADAIDARTAASADAQQSLDQLVTTFGAHLGSTSPADRAAVNAALESYLQHRRMVRQLQQQHPYPAPPRETCR